MNNIFKDNEYFNQNIMDNDNFKYWFKILTSQFNMKRVNSLIAPVLYESDNNTFEITNSNINIQVERNNLTLYENNSTIEKGFFNIKMTNINGYFVEMNYSKEDNKISISSIENNDNFTVTGIENENGVIYVDANAKNKYVFPYRKTLSRTSK